MTDEEKRRIEESMAEWNWRQFYRDTRNPADRNLNPSQVFNKHDYTSQNFQIGDQNDKAKDITDSNVFNNTGTDNHRDIRNTDKDERGNYIETKGSKDIDTDKVFIDQLTSQVHEINNLEAAALLITIRKGEEYIYKEKAAKAQINMILEKREDVIRRNEEKIEAAIQEAKGINEFTAEDREMMAKLQENLKNKKDELKETKGKIKELEEQPKEFGAAFVDTKALENHKADIEKEISGINKDIERYKRKEAKTKENRELRQKIDILKAIEKNDKLTEEESAKLEKYVKLYGRRYKVEHWLNLMKAKNQLIAAYIRNENERMENINRNGTIDFTIEDYEKAKASIEERKEDINKRIKEAKAERENQPDNYKKAIINGRIIKLEKLKKTVENEEIKNENKKKILDTMPKFDPEAYRKNKESINIKNAELNKEIAELNKSSVFKEEAYKNLLNEFNNNYAITISYQKIIDKNLEYLEQEKKRVKSPEEIIAINRMNAAKKRLMEVIAVPAIKEGMHYTDRDQETNKEITFDTLADIYEKIQNNLVTYVTGRSKDGPYQLGENGEVVEKPVQDRAIWKDYNKIIEKNTNILKNPQIKKILADKGITVYEGKAGYIRTLNEAAEKLYINKDISLTYKETNDKLNTILKDIDQLEPLPVKTNKTSQTTGIELKETYIKDIMKSFRERIEGIRYGENKLNDKEISKFKDIKKAEDINKRLKLQSIDSREENLFSHVSKLPEKSQVNEIYNILQTERTIGTIQKAIKNADRKDKGEGYKMSSGETWSRKDVDYLNVDDYHEKNYKTMQNAAIKPEIDITPADKNNVIRAILNNPVNEIMAPTNEKVTERMRESIRVAADRYNMKPEEYLEKAEEELRKTLSSRSNKEGNWKKQYKDYSIEKTEDLQIRNKQKRLESTDTYAVNKDGKESDEREIDRKNAIMIAGDIHTGEDVTDYLERRQSEETTMAIRNLRADNLETILGSCTEDEKQVIKIHANSKGIDARTAAASLLGKSTKNITDEDILAYEDVLKSARRKVAYNCYEMKLINYEKLNEIITVNMNDKAKNDYMNNKYIEHQAEYDRLKADIEKEFAGKKANIILKIQENKTWEEEKVNGFNKAIDRDNKALADYRKELEAKGFAEESVNKLVEEKIEKLNKETDKLITEYEKDLETRKRYIMNLEKNALYRRNERLNALSIKGNELEEERKGLEIENFRYKKAQIKDLKEAVKIEEKMNSKDPEILNGIEDKKEQIEMLEEEMEYGSSKWNSWYKYSQQREMQETAEKLSAKEFDERYQKEYKDHTKRMKEIPQLEKEKEKIEKSEGFNIENYHKLTHLENEIKEKKTQLNNITSPESISEMKNAEAKDLEEQIRKKLDDKSQYEEDFMVADYNKTLKELESIKQKKEENQHNELGSVLNKEKQEKLEKSIESLSQEKARIEARQVPNYQERAENLAKTINVLKEEKEKLETEKFGTPLSDDDKKSLNTKIEELEKDKTKYESDEIVNNYRKTLAEINSLKEKQKENEKSRAGIVQDKDRAAKLDKEIQKLETERDQIANDPIIKNYKEKVTELEDKKYQEKIYSKTHVLLEDFDVRKHYNYNIAFTKEGKKFLAEKGIEARKAEAEKQAEEARQKEIQEEKNRELRKYIYEKDKYAEMKMSEYREKYKEMYLNKPEYEKQKAEYKKMAEGLVNVNPRYLSVEQQGIKAKMEEIDRNVIQPYEKRQKEIEDIEKEVKPYIDIRNTLTKGTGTEEQRKYQSIEKQAEYLQKIHFFGESDDIDGDPFDGKPETQKKAPLEITKKKEPVKVQAPVKAQKPQEKQDKGREREGVSGGYSM